MLVLSLLGWWGGAGDGAMAQGPAALGGGVPGACDAIAAAWGALPGARVARSEGEFEDPVAGRGRTGCRVTVKGAFGALGAAQRPETRVVEVLQGRGLRYDDRYAADGPDGTSFALRADGMLCVVHGRWDGGDDSDPDYVPGDWYEFFAGCASLPAGGKS